MNAKERILSAFNKRNAEHQDMRAILDIGLTTSERDAVQEVAQRVGDSGAPGLMIDYFFFCLACNEQTKGRNPRIAVGCVVDAVSDFVEVLNAL